MYDERNPAPTYLIARLGLPEFPSPIGVFTTVEHPCSKRTTRGADRPREDEDAAGLATLFGCGDARTVS